MLGGLQWLLLILPFQIEQIGGANLLAGEPAAGRRDRGNTAPRGFHPPQPYPQQMLAAVTRLPREMRRFDPSTLQKRFESCRHVQYVAL